MRCASQVLSLATNGQRHQHMWSVLSCLQPTTNTTNNHQQPPTLVVVAYASRRRSATEDRTWRLPYMQNPNTCSVSQHRRSSGLCVGAYINTQRQESQHTTGNLYVTLLLAECACLLDKETYERTRTQWGAQIGSAQMHNSSTQAIAV